MAAQTASPTLVLGSLQPAAADIDASEVTSGCPIDAAAVRVPNAESLARFPLALATKVCWPIMISIWPSPMHPAEANNVHMPGSANVPTVQAVATTMPNSATTEPPILSDARPADNPTSRAGSANDDANSPRKKGSAPSANAVTDHQTHTGPRPPGPTRSGSSTPPAKAARSRHVVC